MSSFVKIEKEDGHLSGVIPIKKFLKGYRPDGQMKCPSCGKASMHFRKVSKTKGNVLRRTAHFATNPGQEHEKNCPIPTLQRLEHQRINMREAVAQGKSLILNLNGDGLTHEKDSRALIKGKRHENLGKAIGRQKRGDKDYLNISIKSAQDYVETTSLIRRIQWDLDKTADVHVSFLGCFYERDVIELKADNLASVQTLIDNVMHRSLSSRERKNITRSEPIPLMISLPFTQEATHSLSEEFNVKVVNISGAHHSKSSMEWHSPEIDVQHLGLPFYPFNQRSGANTRQLPWQKIKFIMRHDDDVINAALMARERFKTPTDLMAVMDETAVRAAIYKGLFTKYKPRRIGTLAIELSVKDPSQIMLGINHAVTHNPTHSALQHK